MVLKPADGKPATHANGGTISFEAPSRAAVAAFHKAALAAGGKDEGAVGPRGFWPNAYAGYVRDPDGNKLAPSCRKPEYVHAGRRRWLSGSRRRRASPTACRN